MDKIDKTKENIGVTNLDKKTREKLFEKFVDGGGRVIDDKTRRKQLVLDREKQKKQHKRSQHQTDKRSNKDKQEPQPAKPPRPPQIIHVAETHAFFYFLNSLRLRFKLKSLGVTTLDGYYFKKKFFLRFNNIYKAALMELQILYLEMFKRYPSSGSAVIRFLDSITPLYYELIEMTGNLFDKILTDQIVEQYINFPDVPKKVIELREPLFQLFKKMYVLEPHKDTIRMAFERAIDNYVKREDFTQEYPSVTKRRMRRDLFIVFQKLYPRLRLLYSYLEAPNIRRLGTDIGSALLITDAEKPGSRMRALNSDEARVQPAEHEETVYSGDESKETDEARMKDIKRGLDVMSELSMSNLRKEYDKTRLFEHVSDIDKVFITYLLFNEFDKEYSFILTTNKIRYRTDVIVRTRKDFKTGLITLYEKLKISADGLKEYAEELRTYEKSRNEKPHSGAQYIEFTKRMEAFQRKKDISGKKALMTVRDYMNEIAGELHLLVKDMDGQQLYIENPQEQLIFDPLIEGDKKLNKKKIFEAVYLVYCYALAFAYRLGSGGDLSGDIEFKKEELDLMQKTMQGSPPQEKADEGSENQKSILEQLDDLL